ncbi:glutamate receptor-interacting protein 1-like [Pomacea canaliculata]|nr:glutamate receptor-interacting protein 1-like [Pomacea canaliculata]
MADVRISDDEWDDGDDTDDNAECAASHPSEASSFDADEWARTLGDLDATSGSEMLRQISASLRQRSTFSLDRRSNTSDSKQRSDRQGQSTSQASRSSKSQDGLHRYNEKSKSLPGKSRTIDQQLQTIFTPTPIQLQRVTIEKSSAAQDFGFSLSDGMYEKGVYVSAVRIGSPAHSAGLRSFDRILQVNGTKTRDFDCCMTVPLIAEAGNNLRMVICRNPLLRPGPRHNRF